MCKFSVVPGNGKALLGIPDIGALNIIKINCNTIDTDGKDSADNCSTNTAIHHSYKHVQHYTNMMQDVDRAEKSCTNIDAISKFKNKDKTMIINKEPNTISYFLPGSNQDNDKRVSAEITQQLQKEFKDMFNGIGCIDGTFSLQIKPGSKPYQASPRYVAYAL